MSMTQPKPFHVVYLHSLLGEFDTELEAAEFIETLPGYLEGRYSLDGPSDDWDELYTGWVNDHGVIRWQERSDP